MEAFYPLCTHITHISIYFYRLQSPTSMQFPNIPQTHLTPETNPASPDFHTQSSTQHNTPSLHPLSITCFITSSNCPAASPLAKEPNMAARATSWRFSVVDDSGFYFFDVGDHWVLFLLYSNSSSFTPFSPPEFIVYPQEFIWIFQCSEK